jgi:hypothetical protein
LEHERDSIVVPRVRFDMTGQIVDTIGRYVAVSAPLEWEYVNVGRSRYGVPVTAPATRFSVEVLEGRIVIEMPSPASEEAAELWIRWHDHQDRVIQEPSYDYRPIRFIRADMDSRIASYIGQGTQDAPPGAETRPRARPRDSAAAHAALRERMKFAEFHLPVNRMHLGADGALWFQLTQPSAAGPWIALDTAGTPVGRFTLPARATSISWSRGERFIAVEKDEFDVPWLVVYRLVVDSRVVN